MDQHIDFLSNKQEDGSEYTASERHNIPVFQPTNLDMTLAFRASSDIGHCPPRESSSQLL